MKKQFEDYIARKPWEGTKDRFGIYDHIVNRAVKNKSLLRIFYEGKIAIHDPRQWRKTGEVIYRIYKRPDEPMRLFVNTANFIKPKTAEEEERELVNLGVFG